MCSKIFVFSNRNKLALLVFMRCFLREFMVPRYFEIMVCYVQKTVFLSEIMISMRNAVDICRIRPNDLAPFLEHFSNPYPYGTYSRTFIPDRPISCIFSLRPTRKRIFYFRHSQEGPRLF